MSKEAKAIVDRITPGMIEREPETIETWIDAALAHERELLPCGHPRWAWCPEPDHPPRTEEEANALACAWCESLAHERQKFVEELKEFNAALMRDRPGLVKIYTEQGQAAAMSAIYDCHERIATFIKRLTEGK